MTYQETILKATQTAEWLHAYTGGHFAESFFSYLKEIREENKIRVPYSYGFDGDLENYLRDKYGIWIEEKWDAYYIGSFGSKDHFFCCYLRYLRDNTSALAERLPKDFTTKEFNIFQEKMKELWDIDDFLNRFFIFVDFQYSFNGKETSNSLWIFHRTPIFALED